MLANLLGRIPSQELRVVLGERVGGTGQYGGASDDPNNFYLPLWGDSCRVVLTYDGAEIIGVERGPALSVEEWERLNEEIKNSLVGGPQTIGRDFSFNGHGCSAGGAALNPACRFFSRPRTRPWHQPK